MFYHEDQRERLREKVAAEHRFQLYKRYSERSAAERISVDYSTLKRKRRAGLVPFVDLGGGSIAYMGYQIADIILFGVKATEPWPGTPDDPFSSANGSSTSATEAQPIIAPATTGTPASSSALALARSTLKMPAKS
jgi:hypothetical protein